MEMVTILEMVMEMVLLFSLPLLLELWDRKTPFLPFASTEGSARSLCVSDVERHGDGDGDGGGDGDGDGHFALLDRTQLAGTSSLGAVQQAWLD